MLNVAVGGSVARHLSGQLASALVGPDDVVVVSIGTNDAADLTPLSAADFEAALDGVVRREPGPRRWVYLAPPGVLDDRPGALGRTTAGVTSYAALAAARFDTVIDTPALLAPLGPSAFLADGVHLTAAGYDVVLPAIAAACR